MNSRERVAAAMRLEVPDRVPVMCQLALGHYFLHVDLPNEEIWFDAEGFPTALIALAHKYRFDGALVNLMSAPPDWCKHIDRVETQPDGSRTLYWKPGGETRIPVDDNLHHFPEYVPPSIVDVDPAKVFYDDPHGLGGMKYPFYFGFDPDSRSDECYFPDYLFGNIDVLKSRIGGELSIHAEVFSPFTQLMELLGYVNALVYMVTDAEKCHDILARYAKGTAELALKYAARDVDAVLISSAFAGAGFISRDFYKAFVQPYEKRVVDVVHDRYPDLPVYVHTCGAIGDRLELMLESGLNGVDTLDPPPLGNVELTDAVQRLSGKAFIKGNINAVDTLLKGSVDFVRRDATMRVQTAGPGGGYILSSACSVAPRTAPENLAVLAEVAEEHGRFGKAMMQ